MRKGLKGNSIAMGVAAVLVFACIVGASGWAVGYPLRRAPEGLVTTLDSRIHPDRGKDQSRLPSMAAAGGEEEEPQPVIELAQAFDLPGGGPPFGGAVGPHLPGRGVMGLFGQSLRGSALSPRQACEEHVDRHMAIAAYLKSKLRLQGAQVEAWQKIEAAAAPTVEALRNLCADLPTRAGSPPSMPEVMAHAEKRLSAMLDFVRAVREPMRALYEMLSADQRAALMPPMLRPPF
jgi:hypothetical protein